MLGLTMVICENCKTEIDESQKMPTEVAVLCSVDCADESLEKLFKEVSDREKAFYAQQKSAPVL